MRPLSDPASANGWSAEADCPQCGGGVSLEVGDPVLLCPFCRTSLYLSPGRPLRYRLAARGAAAASFHLPFWRIRGVRYRAHAEPAGVEGNLLDATVPAWKGAPAGANLGVRPQAARLTLVSGGGAAPALSADEAQAAAEARYDHLEPARSLFTRLIGESRSLIEAPFRLEEGPKSSRLREALPDAASYLLDPSASRAVRALGERTAAEEPVTFLPLLCPECGHGLPAASRAVAFLCGQCARGWRVTAQGLTPLPVLGAPAGSRQARLFPFWRLAFAAEGLPFVNRAELRRWAVPYQTAPSGWDGEPPALLVPAFKAQPRTFLRTAKLLSIAPLPPPGALSPGQVLEAEPVRLPVTEAAQALKPVLAHLVETFRRAYPAVAPAKLLVTAADLWFLPFEPRGAEWIHAPTGLALQAASVRHGAGL